MNKNILKAIESICEDIASSSDAKENRTRAEAIALLTASNLIIPTAATGILLNEEKTSDSGEAPSKSVKRPSPGEHFTYNGLEHIILGEEQGGVLAIRAETLDEEKPFDKNNKNDWRISSLRVDLNENEIKNYNKGDLLPFVSDLTADNGDKSYGTCKDYLFILSCDLIRKYRDLLPKYKDDDIVTLTPWKCGTSARYVRYLDTHGTLSYSVAYISYGVALACLFNPSIFE